MVDARIINAQARTDVKIRYAGVHLSELRQLSRYSGDEFCRAHLESFFFHLFGARDAFLAELNIYYDAGLPDKDIAQGKLHDALARKGRHSPELAELWSLENSNSSWLKTAKDVHDLATHVKGAPHIYYSDALGGFITIQNPRTGEEIRRPVLPLLEEFHTNMGTLIERLRDEAMQKSAL